MPSKKALEAIKKLMPGWDVVPTDELEKIKVVDKSGKTIGKQG